MTDTADRLRAALNVAETAADLDPTMDERLLRRLVGGLALAARAALAQPVEAPTPAATRETLLREALTAFGHHADDCEYALTVCTCGFTDAMRTLLVNQGDHPMTETPETLRDALLAEPAVRRHFPDDVNGIPGRGNLQWLRQYIDEIIAAARAEPQRFPHG